MQLPPLPVNVESAFTSTASDIDSSSRPTNAGEDPFDETLDSLLEEPEVPTDEAPSANEAEIESETESDVEVEVEVEAEVEAETESEDENESQPDAPIAIELPDAEFMMAAKSSDHLMEAATNESSVVSPLESTLSGVLGGSESGTANAVAGLAATTVTDDSQAIQPAAASANPLIENNTTRLPQPVSPSFVRDSYQAVQLDGELASIADVATVVGATNGDPIALDPSAAATVSTPQVEAIAATELNPVSDVDPLSANVVQELAEGEVVLPVNANVETTLSAVESESEPSRVAALQSPTGEAIPAELMRDPGSDAQSDLTGESNLTPDDPLAEINPTTNDAIGTVNAETIDVRGNSNVGATPNVGTVNLETAELIATQIGEHVIDARQSMENGRTTLEVKLNPPELGKLTIELHEDNDLLTARLIVAEKATLETMKSTLPDLMRSLAESGVDVTDMQLESSSQEKDAPSEQENEASWDASDAATESPLSPGSNRFTRSSGVNVLA